MKKTLKDKIIKQGFIIFLFFTLTFCQWETLYAKVPHLINYQGRVADGKGQFLKDASFTFRIYNKDGKLLWDETHSNVAIKNGVFNILLGSIAELKLKFDEQYYLEILINEEKMEPKQEMCSVANVYRSEFSDNDLSAGSIIMWSGSIASIPEGWALCDGTKGTPDLRDKFIIGAASDQGETAKTTITGAQTQSGGAKEIALTLENMPTHRHLNPSHTHIGPAHTHKGPLHQHKQVEHTHGINGRSSIMVGGKGFQMEWLKHGGIAGLISGGGGDLTESAGNNETSVSGGEETESSGEYYLSYEGSGTAQNNLPPYYAVAFIMKE